MRERIVVAAAMILMVSAAIWVGLRPMQAQANCVYGGTYTDGSSNIFYCTGTGTAVQMAKFSDVGGGGLPAGLIALSVTGACPTGFAEVTALNGKTVIGTLAANGDVGTTGGSDTLTPTGVVSAPTFTGNAVNSTLVSGGTPTGTIAWPAGVPVNGAIGNGTFTNAATATSGNCAATNIAAGTGSATACKAAAPNLTVPAHGHTGALTTPTITWPAGVPTYSGTVLATHQHSTTATGTNSIPTFTGTVTENRSAFIKAIFCTPT